MGYQIYQVGKRWGGYGVPAVCEHPDCDKEIDRGGVFNICTSSSSVIILHTL